MEIEIKDEAELRELYGFPAQRAATKERKALHQVDRDWLAASPFCLIATAGADGTCDVSPKGDPPGFTHVIDDVTIAIPDRPGNKRIDGLRNILLNPHVGLLYFLPGRGDTLRINGRARLVRDAPYFDAMVVKGHRPQIALVVHIEQIFFHCAKAFMRSGLWEPETWDPTGIVPRRAVLAHEVEAHDQSIAELDDYYRPEHYRRGLYA